MLEWLKRHAWKACIPLKGIGGSNPPLSAKLLYFHFFLRQLSQATTIMKTPIARLAIVSSLILLFSMSFMGLAYAQNAGNAKPSASVAQTKAPVTKSQDASTTLPSTPVATQTANNAPATTADSVADTAADTTASALDDSAIASAADDIAATEAPGFHKTLKTKFIEGDASFMSLVAIALIIGLAFCIERIIYLTLSEIDTDKFMAQLDSHIAQGNIEEAKNLCRDTRGPIASICYQGLVRADQPIEDIERSVASYGTVQAANLEKGCSWITLFIAMAPSLGFLGTVIGMVMAFEQIQTVGDINPTIVAAGMKVALITTIFGIIVALVLQLFYNYILSKIDRLTIQMEECAITLLDSLVKLKASR